jgi:hypothetical protein
VDQSKLKRVVGNKVARTATEEFVQQQTGRRELPKAVRGDGNECVIARAVGAHGVGGRTMRVGSPGDYSYEVELPPEVSDFIKRFDAGEYPDLDEKR